MAKMIARGKTFFRPSFCPSFLRVMTYVATEYSGGGRCDVDCGCGCESSQHILSVSRDGTFPAPPRAVTVGAVNINAGEMKTRVALSVAKKKKNMPPRNTNKRKGVIKSEE
jgi:hypothetical protein